MLYHLNSRIFSSYPVFVRPYVSMARRQSQYSERVRFEHPWGEDQ